MTYPSTAYTARWVWCAPGDLRPGAAVTLQDGWITEVAARPPRGARVVDLGEGLLLPGLVNAHTHLELSGLAGLMPPQGDFVVWLESMVNLRPVQLRQNGPEATLAAVEYLAQSGTALVGDVTNTGKAAQALGSAGVSAVSFYEALGAAKAEPPEAQASWQGALLLASAVAAHAPYSIPTARLAALKAKAGAMPFAIHLAESRAEVEFLAGRGSEGRRLEEFLRDRGLRREDLDLAAATPWASFRPPTPWTTALCWCMACSSPWTRSNRWPWPRPACACAPAPTWGSPAAWPRWRRCWPPGSTWPWAPTPWPPPPALACGKRWPPYWPPSRAWTRRRC